MRLTLYICLSIITSAFLTSYVYAAGEPGGDLDVTIRVIDSKQSIKEFINRIELPKGVPENVPATPARTQGTDSSTSHNGREKRNNEDERRKSGKHANDDDDQSRQQIDSSESNQSWMSERRHRASEDISERSDSRERRENLQSHSDEQRESLQEGVRDTIDSMRDDDAPSAWREEEN